MQRRMFVADWPRSDRRYATSLAVVPCGPWPAAPRHQCGVGISVVSPRLGKSLANPPCDGHGDGVPDHAPTRAAATRDLIRRRGPASGETLESFRVTDVRCDDLTVGEK